MNEHAAPTDREVINAMRKGAASLTDATPEQRAHLAAYGFDNLDQLQAELDRKADILARLAR